jgi:hypothetical protein
MIAHPTDAFNLGTEIGPRIGLFCMTKISCVLSQDDVCFRKKGGLGARRRGFVVAPTSGTDPPRRCAGKDKKKEQAKKIIQKGLKKMQQKPPNLWKKSGVSRLQIGCCFFLGPFDWVLAGVCRRRLVFRKIEKFGKKQKSTCFSRFWGVE